MSYLGVSLDQSLSGEIIASSVLSKCANKLKFLYRNTRSFNLKTKKLLVSALIQCHFDYACSSWYSGLTKKLKGRLQVLQNNIIRYILSAAPRTHIGYNQFKLVGMLNFPVELRVEQLKLNHMFNIINHCAPEYLNCNIEMVRNRHSYRTRASELSCVVPRVSGMGKSSFAYTGIGLWNSLPLSVKQSHTKHSFKKHVKSFLWNKLEVKEHNIL